jgi:hypothetical protein
MNPIRAKIECVDHRIAVMDGGTWKDKEISIPHIRRDRRDLQYNMSTIGIKASR